MQIANYFNLLMTVQMEMFLEVQFRQHHRHRFPEIKNINMIKLIQDIGKF